MMDKKDKQERLEEIREMKSDLENAQSHFLEKCGWKYTSHYPDYRWRWSKVIHENPFMCDKETALKIERDFLK